MSEFFKLDINSYTKRELEELLNLKYPYTIQNVIESHKMLVEKLTGDDTVDNKKKKEIKNFVDKVKFNLMDRVKQIYELKSSSLLEKTRAVIMDQGAQVTESSRDTNNSINIVPRNEEGIIQKQLYTTVVNISSIFRKNFYTTNSNNFTFTLPNKIKNVVKMELTSFELPTCFYQISRHLENNYFWIQKTNTTGPVNNWYFISIPEGNYTRANIIIAINDAINSALSSTSELSISINDNNLKTIFKHDTANGAFTAGDIINIYFNRFNEGLVTPQLTTTEPRLYDGPNKETFLRSSLGWILGFRFAAYKDSITYVGEALYNSWNITHIYLVVDDFNKSIANHITMNDTNSIGNPNILSRLATTPIDTDLSISTLDTYFDEEFSSKKRLYYGPVDIDKLQISLIDCYGRLLDLNNMDFTISLSLQYIYD
tara:strand:- start:3226 stop:4509 length:1284 start_codon:yes stop_codon:yes gene_type:complete